MAPRRSTRNSRKTPSSDGLNKPKSGETIKKTNRDSVATSNQTKRVTKTGVAKPRVANKKSNTMKGVAKAFVNPNKKTKHVDAGENTWRYKFLFLIQ
jgi:hypothetical protein